MENRKVPDLPRNLVRKMSPDAVNSLETVMIASTSFARAKREYCRNWSESILAEPIFV